VDVLSNLRGFLLMAAGAGALTLAVPGTAVATDATAFVTEGTPAAAAKPARPQQQPQGR